MARNSMSDLQNHLFETIERLKANNDPSASENERIDLATAKAINQAAATIIESAKVEVEFLAIIAKAENPEAVITRSNGLMLGRAQK